RLRVCLQLSGSVVDLRHTGPRVDRGFVVGPPTVKGERMSAWEPGIPRRYEAESVFRPENLMREARRQRRLEDLPVPRVCLLDPDGDVVRYLSASGQGTEHPAWACYHTRMWCTEIPTPNGPVPIGVVGMAVGAP